MTTKRSSILTEGLRPEGSSHPLSLTRPLWLKKNRIGRVCARLVNFLISSFACAKKRKIEKSKNKSNEVSSKTHPAWKLSKTISRKQGRYNPRKFVSRSSTSCLLNFPYLKNLKRLKENLKRVYKLFDFQKEERPPQAGSCYKIWHLSKKTVTQRRKLWFSFDKEVKDFQNPTGCFKKTLWQNSQQRMRKIWFSHDHRKRPPLEIRTLPEEYHGKRKKIRTKKNSVSLSIPICLVRLKIVRLSQTWCQERRILRQ